MHTSYTFLFFAFILLFSNSSLAYRMFSNPYEQDQDPISALKRMDVVPTEGDSTWLQNALSPSYQTPDGKYFIFICLCRYVYATMIGNEIHHIFFIILERARRGWGSGRRRRSI